MILYDKKSNFLGMGQSELSILGYEDMEEFKSYFDDFADLFVDHPGYISKFKNFSWIDYALHSGAPNKNVLLKHKNGTDIETQLQISEVSLIQPINDESTVYCIELGINTSLTDSVIKQNIKLSRAQEDEQEQTRDEEKSNDIQQHIQNDEHISDNSMHNFDEILIDDYKEDEQEDEDIHLKTSVDDKESTQNEENFETTLDDDLKLKEETAEITTDEDTDTTEDILIKSDYIEKETKKEEDHPARLKVIFDDEDIKDLEEEKEEKISLVENSDISDVNIEPTSDFIIKSPAPEEDTVAQKSEEEDIDLTQIAEDTGMDLSDIAEFIEDFIKESENYLEKLNNHETLSNSDLVKNETIKLKGISSNLKITSITNTLNSISQETDHDKLNNLLRLFKEQIKNLEEQLF